MNRPGFALLLLSLNRIPFVLLIDTSHASHQTVQVFGSRLTLLKISPTLDFGLSPSSSTSILERMILVHMHLKTLFVACSLIIAACPAVRSADLNFTVQQVGSNVVVNTSGFVNKTSLIFSGPATDWGRLNPSWFLGGSVLINGPTTVTSVDGYTGISGSSTFASGPPTSATSGSGDTVGIISNGTDSILYVPFNYVSGSPITSSSTYSNKTVSGLGLILGTYNWSWGSGATAGTAQMTISNVPEPSTYALGVIATGVLAVLARRKRNQKTA